MASTTQDKDWIEDAIRTITLLEPRERGLEHVRVREAWAHHRASGLPIDRIPKLIVALFELYDTRKSDAFVELMWLLQALYTALPRAIEIEDACAILAATRHSCGHGGVEAPIELARSSFGTRPYTRAFCDALRAYRDRLKGLHSAEVTRARGVIALTIWQDPQEPLRPRNCLSHGVRDGFFALPEQQRGLWTNLLLHVDRTSRRRPDRKWVRAASPALEGIGSENFAIDLAHWLIIPEGPVPLSTGGRHVVKTLIWFAALSKSYNLDNLISALIDVNYTEPKAAVPLIYAVGYWLESRPPEVADSLRARLRNKWPRAGSRIRDGVT
ncbi:MAG: hypothetical protein WD768_01350 [Phycisphaeraceae bacterium]